MISKLIREGNKNIKETFEGLLKGENLRTKIDEQIVYSQLDYDETAVWSLLLVSGYLKVAEYQEVINGLDSEWIYELAITNHETRSMFADMIKGWFGIVRYEYNDFAKAMLLDDVDMMNLYMNRLTCNCFSYFDTGVGRYQEEPERFYHGFVLGLLVELQNEYIVTSNRESGFGRYDVVIEPKDITKLTTQNAMILEFKVMNHKKEISLEDTVQAALDQIEEKRYTAALMERGIPRERIRCYGFAFRGKEVMIG